tara:strand:+ start:166 stop:378 length:213 start_codon:yes stop_codon:yes gene_type:complete
MKKISNKILDKLKKQRLAIGDLDSATIEYFAIRWMQTKELGKHYGNDTELGASTRILLHNEPLTIWNSDE